MKINYYKELDGVRAIAALMVMFSHYDYSFLQSKAGHLFASRVAVIGQSGVSLFFALSGFLITRILLTTKKEEHYFKNFYIRRTLRIFPLYYFFLLFFYFVYPFLLRETIPPFQEQIYFWVYLQDFSMTFDWPASGPGAFWSLAVEEHFYLFWPLLVYLLNRKQLYYALAGLILLSIGTRYILTVNHFKVFYFTFSRLDELALGSLMAMLDFGRANKTKASWCLPAFVLGMTATLMLFGAFSGDALPAVQIIKYCIVAVTYTAFVGLILSFPDASPIKRFMRNKFLAYTGKISYGLYVYHPVCFILYQVFFKTGWVWLDFALSFLLAYATAGLSYKYIESYFLRWKDKFSYKVKAQRSKMLITQI